MTKEIWSDINGFEGIYEVSNLGRIKSLKCDRSKILKPKLTNYGYHTIGLYMEGKQITFKIHRLVAIAFIINPQNRKVVNHINGIKTDNRANNLEWCTYMDNAQHAVDTGLLKSNNKRVIYINVRQIDDNGNVVNTFKDIHDAIEKENVCGSSLYRCITKQANKHHGYRWEADHITIRYCDT